MRVQELIAMLQQYDPMQKVYILDRESERYREIEDVVNDYDNDYDNGASFARLIDD